MRSLAMSAAVRLATASVPAPAACKLRLAVSKGPNAGLALEAAGVSLTIGTSRDNDLVLSDHAVSPRHCEVMLVDGGVRVRDTSSSAGVLVGNCRVRDAVFSGSVTLQLGRTIVDVWLTGNNEPEAA